MEDLYLYNSLNRKKEKFIPSNSPVSLYSCGPTVYNFSHIGNLRSFIFSDLLHRTLLYCNYKVDYIMNITDVDDKTIRDSQTHHMSLKKFTQTFTNAFLKDIQTLFILPAREYPRATHYIDFMIKIINKLKEKGYTYEKNNSVYFKINQFKKYGALNQLDISHILPQSRQVNLDEYDKENVSDFVLWKAYSEKDGDVFWDSPYGKGRPGWHIECSAMSMSLLGESIDIHTGGIDNAFPHHENEIAQSEAYTDKTFCHYWLHCNHLIVNGEKMSKSLGNIYTLQDLLQMDLDPRAIRYELISTHYRSRLNFKIESVSKNLKPILKIEQFAQNLAEQISHSPLSEKNSSVYQSIKEKKEKFKSCILNDLNTSGALGAIFEIIHLYYKNQSQLNQLDIQNLIQFTEEIQQIFGLFDFKNKSNETLNIRVQELLSKRKEARKNKNYSLSDQIRDELSQIGYKVIDEPSGQQRIKNTRE